MKTLKKSLAVLLAALMLFSTFTFIIANATDKYGRITKNIQIAPPVAGEKAAETFKADDERIVPGNSEMWIYSCCQSPEWCYEEFGRIPTVEEFFDLCVGEPDPEWEEDMKITKPAFIQMIKTGILWVEYDDNDIQILVDAGVLSKEDDAEVIKEYGYAPLFSYLIGYSKVYGFSVEGRKDLFTSSRIMKPGETFKEGKSYICLCMASADIKSDVDELEQITNTLFPYYAKKAEITGKLETATAEEAEKLNNRLESLNVEYADKQAEHKAKTLAIYKKLIDITGNYEYGPEITVNGGITAFEPEAFMLSMYDFGEAQKVPTIIDQIISFFDSIIDFIRSFFIFN